MEWRGMLMGVCIALFLFLMIMAVYRAGYYDGMESYRAICELIQSIGEPTLLK